jgi:hypothetical protein
VEVVMNVFIEIGGAGNVDIGEAILLLALTSKLVGRLVVVVDTRHRETLVSRQVRRAGQMWLTTGWGDGKRGGKKVTEDEGVVGALLNCV